MKKLLITFVVTILIGLFLFNVDSSSNTIVVHETKTPTIKEHKTFIKQVNEKKEIEGKWLILNYNYLSKNGDICKKEEGNPLCA